MLISRTILIMASFFVCLVAGLPLRFVDGAEAVPPTLASSTVSSISSTGATLKGSIIDYGSSFVISRGFQYGLTDLYGSNVLETGVFARGTISAVLSDLVCGSTYHFRSYALNSDAAAYGPDQVFKTSACPRSTTVSNVNPLTMASANGGGKGVEDHTPPIISSIATGAISSSSVMITWKTNEIATSQVEYGLTYSYGNTTKYDTEKKFFHAHIIKGLVPSTIYHFRVNSYDVLGNYSSSFDQVFFIEKGKTVIVPQASSTLASSTQASSTKSDSSVKTTISSSSTPPAFITTISISRVSATSSNDTHTPVSVFPESTIPPLGKYISNLGLGSTGSEVRALQSFLSSYPDSSIYPQRSITGIFDSNTEQALSRYQILRGLKKQGELGLGYFGQSTRDDVNRVLGR